MAADVFESAGDLAAAGDLEASDVFVNAGDDLTEGDAAGFSGVFLAAGVAVFFSTFGSSALALTIGATSWTTGMTSTTSGAGICS